MRTFIALALSAGLVSFPAAAVQTSAGVAATGSQPVHLECADPSGAPVTWSATVAGQTVTIAENTLEFAAQDVFATYEALTGTHGLERADFEVTCRGQDGSASSVPVTVYRPTGRLMIPLALRAVAARKVVHGMDAAVAIHAVGVVDTLPLDPGRFWRPLSYTVAPSTDALRANHQPPQELANPYINVSSRGWFLLGERTMEAAPLVLTVSRDGVSPDDSVGLTVHAQERTSAGIQADDDLWSEFLYSQPVHITAIAAGAAGGTVQARGQLLAAYQVQGNTLLSLRTAAGSSRLSVAANTPGEGAVYLAYLDASGIPRETIVGVAAH